MNRFLSLALLWAGGLLTPGAQAASFAQITLPSGAQAQSKHLALAQAADGSLHGTFSTAQEGLLYLSCRSQCQTSKHWQSVRVGTPEKSAWSVSKVALDAKGGVHLVRAFSGGEYSPAALTYASCTSKCTAAASWKTVALPGRFQVHDWKLETDWFALDPQGRPRLSLSTASPTSGSSGTDRSLLLLACDQGCTAASNWKTARIKTLDFALSSGATALTYDRQGRAHLLAEQDGQLNYYQCAANCAQAQGWGAGTRLAALNDATKVLRSWDIAVSPGGEVFVPFYAGSPAQGGLTVFSCAAQCAQSGAWKKKDLKAAGIMPQTVAAFGLGVDSAFVNGNLTLSFIAKRSDQPVYTEVMTLTCPGACQGGNGAWKAALLDDTRDTRLPDQLPYRYAFTPVRAFTNLTARGQVAVALEPTWGLNYVRRVEVPGRDVQPLAASDAKFTQLIGVLVP